MDTLQFECQKISMKQDKEGYVLTLRVHPDEVPEDLFRDFVGSRYQVVMVRLSDDNQPLDRQQAFAVEKAQKLASVICKDEKFWKFLEEDGEIFDGNEEEAANWLRSYLEIDSRSELRTNAKARDMLDKLHRKFVAWQQN